MIHKRQFVFFTVLAVCFVVADSITAASPQVTDPVSTIRTRYASINKGLTRYKKVKRDLSGYSAEGGELVAYFNGPGIVKLVATYLGEGGKAVEEYYYWDGELIFVFRKQSNYDQPLSGNVVKTQEDRFYFGNKKLIKWINEDGKDVGSGESEFLEKQKEYLKSSRQFLKGSRSKAKTIEATD